MSILAAAAALVIWTLIMLIWMAATRFPAAKKLGIDVKGNPGGRGVDLDPQLPPQTAWKSHNYAHLMEQPTLFYTIIVILFLTGQDIYLNQILAWGYVAIRVAHSIWQSLVNTIPVRLLLFLLSTLCLFALALHASIAALHIT